MRLLLLAASVAMISATGSGMCPVAARDRCVQPLESPTDMNGIAWNIREYWMRQVQNVLSEAYYPRVCPRYPFAAVLVNHTAGDGDLGDMICTGRNQALETGNDILHGEISAIMNCSAILQDAHGQFRLSPDEARIAMSSLTLYSNAESCPMCAAAMRWAGIRNYVYGTSIQTLLDAGWQQITISSADIWAQSTALDGADGGGMVGPIGPVLARETDPYFTWQYDASAPCPGRCTRGVDGQCT
ncbi:hypothetical protein Asppvi_005492 [Aspergillus pseudoviridinutans]|uniref:CMP/dCMP-type deaminase domain-containing protein n=1 Tax=Aspergillus pseudoviridinutans TaxID=1517512 RepID=A0A9P3EUF5_9EURO|nr:uncharacterized protein Asppvi_005492 [Aspergillus pseudoviridinutans]GIJ86602.1 hypothetical protein Asppvi_005492 [Aspergillus pseudoviridinutans]